MNRQLSKSATALCLAGIAPLPSQCHRRHYDQFRHRCHPTQVVDISLRGGHVRYLCRLASTHGLDESDMAILVHGFLGHDVTTFRQLRYAFPAPYTQPYNSSQRCLESPSADPSQIPVHRCRTGDHKQFLRLEASSCRFSPQHCLSIWQRRWVGCDGCYIIYRHGRLILYG